MLTPEQIQHLISIVMGAEVIVQSDEETHQLHNLVLSLQDLHHQVLQQDSEEATEPTEVLLGRTIKTFGDDRYFKYLEYRGLSRWGLHVKIQLQRAVAGKRMVWPWDANVRKLEPREVTLWPKQHRAILALVRFTPEIEMFFTTHRKNLYYGWVYQFKPRLLQFW